jgi:hypothetical protein
MRDETHSYGSTEPIQEGQRLILHGTGDQATRFSLSQLLYDTAGSTDKTIKLYEGHLHDLLNDVDKEWVIADILSWIDARLPVTPSAAHRKYRWRDALPNSATTAPMI